MVAGSQVATDNRYLSVPALMRILGHRPMVQPISAAIFGLVRERSALADSLISIAGLVRVRSSQRTRFVIAPEISRSADVSPYYWDLTFIRREKAPADRMLIALDVRY